MDLGTTISTLRKARKINQNELADRCKITQAYLSLIENNKKEPNLSTLKKIASKLNIPLPVMFYLSIDMGDVPTEKRQVYDAINPSIKKFIEDVFVLEVLADKK